MAIQVTITPALFEEISDTFKGDAIRIVDFIYSLKKSPHKGKALGNVGGTLIKELKYKSFRFYFITDGFKLRCLGKNVIVDILFRFVRMSNKNNQKEIIKEIRKVLLEIGSQGL